MGYYLEDHPNPYYRQILPRSVWRSEATGLVGVHTAEGPLDRIAPDSGAENVANFIATRSDAGGYHELVDTDSFIQMAPDHYMTWHTAAMSLNGPAWGISAAIRSTEWDPDADATKRIIKTMGERIAAFWVRRGIDPIKAARWLTIEQVRSAGGRIVGLYHHGVVQPGDRSDAWVLHPRRARLDQMLVDAILTAATGGIILPTPTTEDDMPLTDADLDKIEARMTRAMAREEAEDKYIARHEGDGGIWLCNEEISQRWHLESDDEVARLQALGFQGRGDPDPKTGRRKINDDGAALQGLRDMGPFFPKD